MGTIRTEIVKRSAEKIVEAFPDSFSTDFQKNKNKLEEVASIPSKKLRNRIAGYITRIKKLEATEKERSLPHQIL
jgi:small subunit ribosomal protein S17e